jgi:hypothetical protein
MQEPFAAGRQHTGLAPAWQAAGTILQGVDRVLSLECADNNKP